MKNIDYRSIDGQLLRTFLVVLGEGSVTKAAEQLGVTQSSVSHSLGRLREFFNDPLFVRSGQQFLPTERAMSLKEPVQAVIDGIEGLTHDRSFDPREEELFFIVAANDTQRDLIFPALVRELNSEGIPIALEFISSGHPFPALMRDARCHLALTPFPPDGTDILQRHLFEAKMMCFYDGSMREAPKTWEEYCQSDHITVRFADGGTSQRALTGVDKSGIRSARLSVQNFAGIPPFVRGTRTLATEIDLMKLCTLRDLDMAPLPKRTDPVQMYMCWHRRSNSDPSHVWLRKRIVRIASKIHIPEK
ncbi:LysR family transcriptional regulator [Primorskyibacter sp. S87]|uniref:LysR family transcriptional regulator n=1 Tax=Primorskyibacter sp. S87 TaxID=3415126 RepID=UPI003C79E5BC